MRMTAADFRRNSGQRCVGAEGVPLYPLAHDPDRADCGASNFRGDTHGRWLLMTHDRVNSTVSNSQISCAHAGRAASGRQRGNDPAGTQDHRLPARHHAISTRRPRRRLRVLQNQGTPIPGHKLARNSRPANTNNTGPAYLRRRSK
jgi:hypothetical protein